MEDEADSFKRARQIALRRLERRECSSFDIQRHLVQKGVTSEIAAQVLSHLKELNLISDERFAKMLTREQAARGKGPYYIQQKLKEKGISFDLNQVKSLTEDVTETSELDAAKKLIERKYPQTWKDKQHVIQGLIRRGFSYSVAREAAKDCLSG